MTRSKDIDEVMERVEADCDDAGSDESFIMAFPISDLRALRAHIRAQEEEIGRLKIVVEAGKPFAGVMPYLNSVHAKITSDHFTVFDYGDEALGNYGELTLGDFRRLSQALAEAESPRTEPPLSDGGGEL